MNSLLWKRRLGRLFGSRDATRRDVILIYHSVAGGPLSTPEARFREQMAWLRGNARVITLSELLDTPNPGELRVVLSFDDGYCSLHDAVHPILTAQGFPAIAYLNSGLLGENQHLPSRPELGHYPNEHFLTWCEAAHLAGHGWTIGGHGVDHVDLTQTLAEETLRQLVDCGAQIEAKLGISCRHFAYTWGYSTPRVRAAVGAAGFHSAVGALHGPVTSSSDRYALPRVDIRADYELRDFIAVVTGRWDYLGLAQRLTGRLRKTMKEPGVGRRLT